ncbi:MAG: Sulfatase protein [Parachlamydiales bacterium]|nr:Sulfatase protein [Parachlamydiales bacterium]
MEPNEKNQVNYLFFSFLFLFLIALTFSHFLRMGPLLWGVPLYFLLYALGQAFLEVFCIMLIGCALHRWMPQWTFKLYIGLSFGLLLAHFTNYTMVRLIDTTLSYLIKFLFGYSLDHARVAFLALNLNRFMLGLIIGTILCVPLLGIGFYWLTHKVSIKRPLALSQKQIMGIVIFLSLSLLALDIMAKPYLNNSLYNKYSKTLPLGSTFIAPTLRRMPLPATVRHARNEDQIQTRLSESSFSADRKPNIYIFVIETLRRDFINSAIAPNMQKFADQNISPPTAYSNANATLLSWFAIFHSNFPYQWTEVRDQWRYGSTPLQIMKKLGYRIRVYGSADLTYFNMDQIIFGKERQLADSIIDFSHLHIEPCDRDRLAMNALTEDASREESGTLFIVFLDSTHSEYSSPKDFSHPFMPMSDSIDYLAISRFSNDLELLKNRYRNSIHWVDHLIGRFFSSLEEKNRYDDAMIVLTGDHGEEFFEEGALFHGTHLNEWQTKIPLFYKFSGPLPGAAAQRSSHLDIFPSILHVLTGQSRWDQYFDGQSLFLKDRWPYLLCVQNNNFDTPYEFCLMDGPNKLSARFLTPPRIHAIPSIELLCLETKNGREMEPGEETVNKHFPNAMQPILSDSAPQ